MPPQPPPDEACPIVDGRVQAVTQPDAATVVLETHHSGQGAARWLLSVHPETARLGRTFARARRGGPPPVFCQWLRTRLVGARVTALERWHPQVPALRLERTPGPDDPPGAAGAVHYLVLELNRRESNLLLLDGDRRLLIALRHPSLPGRRLSAGDPYRLPEKLYAWPQPPALQERFPAADADAARDLERAWQARERAAALAARRTPALQAVRREVKRLQRRLDHLGGDLRAAHEAALWRRRGELLQIHRARLRAGMDSVTVPDVYEPEQPPVAIPLDPQADPGANIERCFRRFRKLRDAAPHVQARIDGTESELARWREVQAEIEAAADAAALEALAGRLPPGAAHLKRLLRGEEAAGRLSAEAPHGPLRRISADGWTILVGRSKEENDRVTFRLGRGRDWWLHVQGRPGSHVIVLSPGGTAPPPTTLREAAWLAGHYSKVRSERHVDVDYTQRKYVRKVKGGEPGQVTYSQHKTLLVDLEDAALRRVLERVDENAPGG